MQLMWFPEPRLISADGANVAETTIEETSLTLASNASWVVGSGPPGGTADCLDCATYAESGSVELVLFPKWRFWAYPFDKQDVAFMLSAHGADLYDCPRLLEASVAADGTVSLVPDTGEWHYVSASLFNPPTTSGQVERQRCLVTIRVSRDPLVFAVKQLAVQAVVVSTEHAPATADR